MYLIFDPFVSETVGKFIVGKVPKQDIEAKRCETTDVSSKFNTKLSATATTNMKDDFPQTAAEGSQKVVWEEFSGKLSNNFLLYMNKSEWIFYFFSSFCFYLSIIIFCYFKFNSGICFFFGCFSETTRMVEPVSVKRKEIEREPVQIADDISGEIKTTSTSVKKKKTCLTNKLKIIVRRMIIQIDTINVLCFVYCIGVLNFFLYDMT